MYITPTIEQKVESLKQHQKREEALKMLNLILAKDPHNEYALLQIADIKYQQGLIDEAQKPIDFLIKTKNQTDPIVWYIKGMIETERANWEEAIKYLKKAVQISGGTNPELLRSYGVALYRGGHRERGKQFLDDAFKQAPMDAEIVYNLAQIAVLESDCKKASEMIRHYFEHADQLQVFDKEKEFYDQKMVLFKEYIKVKC